MSSNAEPLDVEYTEVSASTIDIGTPYSDQQESGRKGFLSVSRKKMCLFVYSHFHLDKLQLLSQEQSAEALVVLVFIALILLP